MIGAALHRPAVFHQYPDQLPSRQGWSIWQLGHTRGLLLAQRDLAYEWLEERAALLEVVGAAYGEFAWRHWAGVGLHPPLRKESLPFPNIFKDF